MLQDPQNPRVLQSATSDNTGVLKAAPNPHLPPEVLCHLVRVLIRLMGRWHNMGGCGSERIKANSSRQFTVLQTDKYNSFASVKLHGGDLLPIMLLLATVELTFVNYLIKIFITYTSVSQTCPRVPTTVYLAIS